MEDFDLSLIDRISNPSVVNDISPLRSMKAKKTDIEIAGFIEANINEGFIFLSFMDRLYSGVLNDLTEVEIYDDILKLRSSFSDYLSDSFSAIVAVDQNAAFPHHRAGNTKLCENSKLILLDTGAHYRCGTTDITRTFLMPHGVSDDELLDDYYRVLRANMALERAKFRCGSTGFQLDAIGRRILWDDNRDFEHGTGHGIGYLTNVHELPYRITKFSGHTKFFDRMVVSNEPGLYVRGNYGIRIETSLLSVLHENDFCSFENISFVPIPLYGNVGRYLDFSDVSRVVEYNRRCLEKVGAVRDFTLSRRLMALLLPDF